MTSGSEVSYQVFDMLNVKPVRMSEEVIGMFEESAGKLGLSSQKMSSGAGHDAMIMAAVSEVGLIFVPSKDGRSHCKEEWTDFDKLQKGIELIYDTILKLGGV